MPLPIMMAHKMAARLSEVRRSGYFLPASRCKTQVTVEYEGDRPVRLDTIVVAAQHHPDVDLDTIRKDIIEHVIRVVAPAQMLDEKLVISSILPGDSLSVVLREIPV